jgi:hypothetical protein
MGQVEPFTLPICPIANFTDCYLVHLPVISLHITCIEKLFHLGEIYKNCLHAARLRAAMGWKKLEVNF